MEGPSAAATSLAFILVAVAAHLGLRWWTRRRLDRDEREAGLAPTFGGPTARLSVAGALTHLLPALVLLLWIHALYAALEVVAPAIGPPELTNRVELAMSWAYRVSVLCALAWLLARIGALLDGFLVSISSRADTAWDDLVLPLAGTAIRRGLPVLALILGAPTLSLSPDLRAVFQHMTSLALIGVVAFTLFQATDAIGSFVLGRHRIDIADNLRARAIYTQVLVLKKVAFTVIAVFTFASMLMVFESVRQFGASILASAGVAGIVVGFAAQRSIATLLAGFQIALTQPIRVDDVVIVEGDWGRIEDITLTYVVVCVWDLRRLIVPITHFIEQPFENWTRTSAEILGTVLLHVDYTVPVEALRAELTRILQASPRWNGKVNVLQVTDAKEHTLEVRALASAADASLAWDLRCEIREQLIFFVQQRYPTGLPRLRATLEQDPREHERTPGAGGER